MVWYDMTLFAQNRGSKAELQSTLWEKKKQQQQQQQNKQTKKPKQNKQQQQQHTDTHILTDKPHTVWPDRNKGISTTIENRETKPNREAGKHRGK